MFLTHHIGPPSNHSHNPQLMIFPSQGWVSLPHTCQSDDNIHKYNSFRKIDLHRLGYVTVHTSRRLFISSSNLRKVHQVL